MRRAELSVLSPALLPAYVETGEPGLHLMAAARSAAASFKPWSLQEGFWLFHLLVF